MSVPSLQTLALKKLLTKKINENDGSMILKLLDNVVHGNIELSVDVILFIYRAIKETNFDPVITEKISQIFVEFFNENCIEWLTCSTAESLIKKIHKDLEIKPFYTILDVKCIIMQLRLVFPSVFFSHSVFDLMLNKMNIDEYKCQLSIKKESQVFTDINICNIRRSNGVPERLCFNLIRNAKGRGLMMIIADVYKDKTKEEQRIISNVNAHRYDVINITTNTIEKY